MRPSSPRGWLGRTFTTRRGRSRNTRSETASVSGRKLAAMEQQPVLCGQAVVHLLGPQTASLAVVAAAT